MRQQFMKELEWFPGCSALYVSIGTGTDLRYLPDDIEVSAIDWTGADISLGMLKKCQKNLGRAREPEPGELRRRGPALCRSEFLMWCCTWAALTSLAIKNARSKK